MAAKQATASATVVRKPKVLTEEDLLKAPEKDYMNEAQLAFFRQRLTDLRDQLLQNADDTGEHLRENEITTDPSDRATLEEEYTLELRTRDRERPSRSAAGRGRSNGRRPCGRRGRRPGRHPRGRDSERETNPRSSGRGRGAL